jgi:hypothetical protein
MEYPVDRSTETVLPWFLSQQNSEFSSFMVFSTSVENIFYTEIHARDHNLVKPAQFLVPNA